MTPNEELHVASDGPVLQHDGEREWLTKVVDDLLDDDLKLVYADWLEERGDPRAAFLRQYVDAIRSTAASDLPDVDSFPREWADLIGFEITNLILREELLDLRETAMRLARPALRLVQEADDESLAIGASKLFGRPDLPDGVPWPVGNDCRAIYNDDPAGRSELAGFCGQVNLTEIAHTFAARSLPSTGVLSFFCYQDIENDDPDTIGARALLLPVADSLSRSDPPGDLTEGNEVLDTIALRFEETLDLPGSYDGPWSDELSHEDWDAVLPVIRERNFENMLGYGRATSGGDPTPNRESRHLIMLENPAECTLHIQIPAAELAKANFDAITLDWVDFD